MLKTIIVAVLFLMANISASASPYYEQPGYSLYLQPGMGTFANDKIDVQFDGQYNLTAYAFDFQELNESLGNFSLILKPGYMVKNITAGITGSYVINGIETDGFYFANAFFSTSLVAYRTADSGLEIPNYFYALGALFDSSILGEEGYPQVITGPIDNEQQLGYWEDLNYFRTFSGELHLSGLALTAPYVNTTAYTFVSIDSIYLTFEVVPSVPEPESFAMILAGLGILGFNARRRIPSHKLG